MEILSIPRPVPRIASVDRVVPGRLYISDQGDAIAPLPDGYCHDLTVIIQQVVFKRADKHDQRKALRAIRLLAQHEQVPGEPWHAFLDETAAEGEKRLISVLESIRCKATRVPLDGTVDVRHLSPNYVRPILVVLRQLFRECCRAHLHAPDSPMDVIGWRTMSIPQRIRWADARNYHPKFGIEHAGHRFFINETPSKPRMLYDPYSASGRLSLAIDAVAPPLIRELKEVQRVNGLRFSDFAFGTAYGYAMAGLQDHFKCRNKQGGPALSKDAGMTPAVQAAVRTRFESEPHPHDPSRTLWDRVVELQPRLAFGGKPAADAQAELETYFLFGRMGCRNPYTYDAYRYWLRKAVFCWTDDHGGTAMVQTNLGPWIPTSVCFRKAAIGAEVRDLFARTTDVDERNVGIGLISEKFHHSSDQTRKYADFEYERDGRRKQLEAAQICSDAQIAARSSSPAPIRSPRLSNAARDRLDRLSSRPRERTE